MHNGTIVQVINAAVPIPPADRRLRLWIYRCETLRFRGGIALRVDAERTVAGDDELTLTWSHGEARTVLTAYQPVSLSSACGANAVVRAVAFTGAGRPLAVLVEIEGLDRPPLAAIERAA